MDTPDEVYYSIIRTIQKLIDLLDNLDIKLTKERIIAIQNRIGQLNTQLEEFSKRYRN